MISMNSVEELRKELDIVNKDITETQSKITMLGKYRNDILNRIRELDDESTMTLDISEFSGEDPLLEAMNTLRDTDEIRLSDVAYMLGLSKPTLLKKVDRTKVRKIKSLTNNKHDVLLVSVEHIKELLVTYNKANKDKRKFVEDVLKYYYNRSLEINIRRPIRKLESLPYRKPEYEDLDMRQLIIAGYNRGFINSIRFNTLMRLLDSFNSPYFVDNRTHTVKKRKEKCIVTVYSN